MVDFAKIMHEMHEAMTPEQRARVDTYESKERRFEATAVDIAARFERLETRDVPVAPPLRTIVRSGASPFGLGRANSMAQQAVRASGKPVPAVPRKTETYVARTWERNVRMRIEEVGAGDDQREIVRFMGAVTGHEAFTLTEDFCRMLSDPEERRMRPRFYICGGTAGRYDACSVSFDDVLEYLRRVRPGMFPEAEPELAAPGMR